MSDPNQSSSQDALLGTSIFGTYTISKKLGEGAMGAVYLAAREDTGQRVALKVLHPRTMGDEETVQRFHREARVISMLSHPNVVRVFVYGETNGSPYMAMEFVEGTSLAQYLGRGPVPEDDAVSMARQICSAIAEAHDLGILHRDIKPENILLSEYRGDSNFVKVLDFGLAKLTGSNQKLTQSGIVYGTPSYMSPEQAQALELDPRSDVYSLGCTLYHMVTGEPPFEGNTAIRTLEMQVFQTPKPPAEIADISQELNAIILKAIEKKPEDRFSSAHAMLAALEQLSPGAVDGTSDHPIAKLIPLDRLNQTAQSTPWLWPALFGALIGLALLSLMLFVTLLVVVF